METLKVNKCPWFCLQHTFTLNITSFLYLLIYIILHWICHAFSLNSHPVLVLIYFLVFFSIAAAEAAYLCTYSYDELKAPEKRKTPPELSVYTQAAENAER